MRSLLLAAVLALGFASAAPALDPGGGCATCAVADSSSGNLRHAESSGVTAYTLDAKGKCHDAHGKFAASSMCHAAAPKRCVKGKACGNTCIKATDVCHKPS